MLYLEVPMWEVNEETSWRGMTERSSFRLSLMWTISKKDTHNCSWEDTRIIFTEEDVWWVHHPHNNELVVNVKIGSRNVYRVLLDNDSSENNLYYEIFKKMGILDREMYQGTTHVYGFTMDSVRVKKTIKQTVTLGEYPKSAIQMAKFIVIKNQHTRTPW